MTYNVFGEALSLAQSIINQWRAIASCVLSTVLVAHVQTVLMFQRGGHTSVDSLTLTRHYRPVPDPTLLASGRRTDGSGMWFCTAFTEFRGTQLQRIPLTPWGEAIE